MDPQTARAKALQNPVVERKTIDGVIKAKVTPAQLLQLWDMIGAAIAQGMFDYQSDLVTLAAQVFPHPRGRQQRRDIGNQMCSLIERLESVEALRADPRLARFFKTKNGKPYISTDVLYAAAVAKLKWDRLHKRIEIDVDEVVDILKDRP